MQKKPYRSRHCALDLTEEPTELRLLASGGKGLFKNGTSTFSLSVLPLLPLLLTSPVNFSHFTPSCYPKFIIPLWDLDAI